MWVQSLDWEDRLEEGTAAHSGILAWRIPWTEQPDRLQVHRVTQSQIWLKQLNTHVHLSIWASPVAHWQRIHLQCRRPGFDSWVGKIAWRRERLPTPVFWPGEFHGLQSTRSQRVGHSWVTYTFTFQRIVYPARLSFRIEGERNNFSDKQKTKTIQQY